MSSSVTVVVCPVTVDSVVICVVFCDTSADLCVIICKYIHLNETPYKYVLFLGIVTSCQLGCFVCQRKKITLLFENAFRN